MRALAAVAMVLLALMGAAFIAAAVFGDGCRECLAYWREP